MSKNYTFISVILFLSLFLSCNLNKNQLSYNTILDNDKKYYVVFLAGQSNMVGLGEVKDLDNTSLPENITFFNYSTNTRLKKLPYNFGPEVGLAKHLNEKFPDLNFIFIKYAVGGSSINEWLPNVESNIKRVVDFGDLYGKFLKMSNSITANKNTENLAFLWMQGETDAEFENTSTAYESNFKTLIKTIREDFNTPNLPIIFGKANPNANNYKFVSNIQIAQENVEKSIPNTYLIETKSLDKLNDRIHYSSIGLQKLGEDFGKVICTVLIEKKRLR